MNVLNNLTIRTKLIGQAIVVLALIITMAAVVYNSVLDTQEHERWVTHTYQVIGNGDTMLAQVLSMQTGYRGFLIVGDESYLSHYNNGLRNYQQLLADTKQLVSDNPAQLARLEQIDRELTTLRSEVFDQGIELRRQVAAGTTDLTDLVRLEPQSKTGIDSVREQLDAFTSAEEQLLATRTAEATQAAATLKATIFGMTAATIILMLGLVLLIATSISRRVGMVASAATGIAAGRLNDSYALPSGRDEIGTLADAFAHMADTIRDHINEQQRANEELRAASETKVAKEYLEEVVRTYSTFAADVAAGNLSTRLNINGSNDELSMLGRNLNHMVESLHTITLQVKETNTAIAAAAAEILAATTQQAAAANEQSAAISQTSTTIEEIKVIATQTAHQADQVARDSQNALVAARQGTQAVEDTVHGMGQIRQRVESIAQTILGLAEQTQTIGDIITAVNQLSDQSNLLALNAAIEAARAGEQGKSFAVVAQHVRDLAERSKAATAQVREILGEIQRSTNNAVLVTDEGTKGVEVGANLAQQAGQVIHRIAAEVEQGAQANIQMAAAAQQQTAGMEQIGQAMNSIHQATTQTLASTRQAEQAAQDLHKLANALQQTVAIYRL